ncbi:conserved hypothetical protein [Alteromonas alvinellae]
MLLSEFFDHLSYGELSQYGVGTDDAGKIANKDYPRIISFINTGLTRIHTKLPLRMDSVRLNTTSDQMRYELKSTADWVEGVDDPFQDNILVINEVIGSDGESLVLNDDMDDATITVAGRTVTFEQPVDDTFTVTYQGNHPKLPVSRRIDPDAIEIDVPDFIIEPLLAFVASKVLGSGGNAESIQEGQMKLQEFVLQIQELIDSGMVRTPTPTTQRTKPYGWV